MIKIGAIILLIILNIWAACSFLLILHAVSNLLFNKNKLKRWKEFKKDVIFAIVWPIAAMSSDGLSYINKNMEK